MTDFKALKLAKAAKLLSDLAYAAVDHRLSDMSRLNRAIVDARKVMDDYMGQFSDEAGVEQFPADEPTGHPCEDAHHSPILPSSTAE